MSSADPLANCTVRLIEGAEFGACAGLGACAGGDAWLAPAGSRRIPRGVLPGRLVGVSDWMICSVLGVLCAELVVGTRMPAPSKVVAASTAELRIRSSSVPSLIVRYKA